MKDLLNKKQQKQQMTPVQMTSALDTKPPHHSVEAIVT